MVLKILVLKGQSTYNVLRLATDEVVAGFRNMKCEVDVVDIIGKKTLGHLGCNFQDYDLIFAMQAVLLELIDPETSEALFGAMKIPYIGWIFDDPLQHFTRIVNVHYDNIALLTVDRLAPETIHTLFPQSKNVHFLPHGGFKSEQHLPKDIDVLIPCSMGARKGEEAFGLSTPTERLMAEGVLKLIKKNPVISPRTALLQIMRMSEIEVSDYTMVYFSNVIKYTFYVAEYDCKIELLDALLESGIKVVVVGNGFEELASLYPKNLQVLPATDIQGVVELINRSKILINPLYPVLEEGFHERIFTAMLNKAVCFTPVSAFLQDQLGERVEYIDLNAIERFPLRVSEVLNRYEDDDLRLYLKDNYEWALENHSWEQRGKMIIERFVAGELMT